MTMFGMDVSRHQKGSHPGNFNDYAWNALPQCDFVIVKATEGYETDFTFEEHFDYCKSQGKLMGAYHYANGKDPIKEAQHFFSVIKSRLDGTVPCLDWESKRNSSWGDKTWCLKFVNEFHRLSGIYPMIYLSASFIAQVANCYPMCALWVAGYVDERRTWNPPSFKWSVKPWASYSIWQYTSSGNTLDRDVAKIDRAGWLKLAGKKEWDEMATKSEVKAVCKEAVYEALTTRHTLASPEANPQTKGAATQSQIDFIEGKMNMLIRNMKALNEKMGVDFEYNEEAL